jgi:redox-sensitive bicupin YhaK (pirin superfamily)
MKTIAAVQSAPRPHWVGDGFPVRSLFTYDSHGEKTSPFLLLDYAGPARFEPGDVLRPRGVGEHPHRGFETVTIVYEGEVSHRDSTGNGGTIGPGDVQWMTAGGGILHEEFHSEGFSRSGGAMEMVQLWVNLPARDKMTAPGYQSILNRDIPDVALPDGAGSLRVIAGEYAGHKGPARTFSPLQVWDVRLAANARVTLPAPVDHTAIVILLRGAVLVNDKEVLRDAQLALLDRAGEGLSLEANGEAKLLVLTGEPIREPIVGYGPFVMNSHEEIMKAIEDFNSGRFGHMKPVEVQRARHPQ